MGKIESYIALRPARFKYLLRFTVEKLLRPNGAASCQVELILTDQLGSPGQNLRLTFVDSTDLQVGDLNATVGWVVGIQNVSNGGLEGITYRVVEEERRSLRLTCRDFQFEVSE